MQTSAAPASDRPRPKLSDRLKLGAARATVFLLWPVLAPYFSARGALLRRRHRKRMALVQDVARYLRRLEFEERNEQDRVHIILRPETWPGVENICDPRDGGCGTRQRFGPLRMQRSGDREVWKLICPNPRCRKQRVALATTPGVRRLQAAALEEFERTGQLGNAYRRFEAAVGAHNRRMAEVRLAAAKRGAGEPPELAAPPQNQPPAA